MAARADYADSNAPALSSIGGISNATGNPPTLGRHWCKLKGPHGGGVGDGRVPIRFDFLKHVYLKKEYFAA